MPKGSIIYFSGVSKTCTREDVKECLDKFDADIAYIDFQRGNTEGWVRLQGENAGKPLLEKTNEGKVRGIFAKFLKFCNSFSDSFGIIIIEQNILIVLQGGNPGY